MVEEGTASVVFLTDNVTLEAMRKTMTFLINVGQSKSLLSVQKNVNIHCAINAVQSLL